MAFINCGACGKPVEIELTKPNVINMEKVSLIIVEHDGQTNCPCGAVIVPAVQNVAGIGIVGIPVPPEQRKKLVVPAGRGVI